MNSIAKTGKAVSPVLIIFRSDWGSYSAVYVVLLLPTEAGSTLQEIGGYDKLEN
jgi:hypothetical protein